MAVFLFMIKQGITKLINDIGLKPFISQMQVWKHRRYLEDNERRRRRWLAGFQKRDVLLHPSTEFTGCQPFDYLKIGWGTFLERDVTIWLSQNDGADPTLDLKEKVFIGRNAYIGVYQPISIGANTIIGAYSYLISGNHRYEQRDVPIRDQGFSGAPIVIRDDVWIGTHVVVLPGVTIREGAIVAAGSIVSKDIPPYEIWGGVPAKFLKHRPNLEAEKTELV